MLGSKQSLLVESVQRLLRRGATERVRSVLGKTRSEDIAHALPLLVARERRQVFDLLGSHDLQAQVLSEVDDGLIQELIEPMPIQAVVTILHEVAADDVADIMAALGEDHVAKILEAMQDAESDEVEDLMGYDPESAGGIMSPDFFSLHRDTRVADAITALQEQDDDVEMAFYVYVTNENGQLVGIVSLRQLVMSKPRKLLSEIMEHDCITVPLHADQEEVAQIVARYNFLAVPVVDEANKLLGIVTVDDIIDVLYEEATEDILKLAGAGQEVSPSAPARDHVRMRYPWLMASCFGGFCAAMIMDPFLESLGVFLALFVPVVMGMAGNVGIQSSTIVVRGLAMGQIDISQSMDIIRREIVVGCFLGVGYGLLVGLAAGGYSYLNGTSADLSNVAFYALCVGSSLMTAILIAATLGTAIPIGLHRLGVDPAVATGPFVTTALDILGILAYFGIAVVLAGAFGIR